MRAPLSINELQIGSRLREYRQTQSIPRTAMALRLGISPDRLATYEAGRARLPAGVALRLASEFDVYLEWLATGLGIREFPREITASVLSCEDERRPFSEVYESSWRDLLTGAADARRRSVEKVLQSLQAAGGDTSRLSGFARAMFERLILELIPSGQRALPRPPIDVDESSKTGFTDSVQSTESRVQSLLSRVREALRIAGTQKALAEVIGVTPQKLHKWLSGEVEPNGESSLRLLEWVSAVEASQKKTAPVLRAPTRRKTQTVKSDERKSGSSPPSE